MGRINLILLSFIATMTMVCSCAGRKNDIRNGDLVFVMSDSTPMSSAISDATSGKYEVSFDHVGIVTIEKNCIFVLEAAAHGGVRLTPWDEFIENAPTIGRNGSRGIKLFRVRPEIAKTTGFNPEAAIKKARQYLGRPYDWSYDSENDAIYCSELVYLSYTDRNGAPLFKAVSMNFKGSDGTFPKFWTELFDRLGIPIPQGEPGTNPNDMAKSDILIEVPNNQM